MSSGNLFIFETAEKKVATCTDRLTAEKKAATCTDRLTAEKKAATCTDRLTAIRRRLSHVLIV